MMKVVSFFLASVAFVGSSSFANAQQSDLYVLCMNGGEFPNNSNECRTERQEVLGIINTCVDQAYSAIAEAGRAPTPLRDTKDAFDTSSTRRELEEVPVNEQSSRRLQFECPPNPTHGDLLACCLFPVNHHICAAAGYRRRNLRTPQEIASEVLGSITSAVDTACTALFHDEAEKMNKIGNHECWQDMANGGCKSFFVTS